VAGKSATGTGGGELGIPTGDSTLAGVLAARRVVLPVAACLGFSGVAGTAETDVDSACGATDGDVVSAGDAGIVSVKGLGGALVAGAGITGGCRASASKANRSAADFVRTYPAAYTARTAAELSATRPFDTFL
jgi:hypothetical protein